MFEHLLVARINHWTKAVRVRLPLAQMRRDFQASFWTMSDYVDFHQVIARLPPSFISVRIYCACAVPDVLRVAQKPLTMLVAKHLNWRTAAKGIVRVVLIHEPIRRMMAKNEIDNIVFRIEDGLQWA
nr:hypothetical protein [Pseudomonas coronafaciens]